MIFHCGDHQPVYGIHTGDGAKRLHGVHERVPRDGGDAAQDQIPDAPPKRREGRGRRPEGRTGAASGGIQNVPVRAEELKDLSVDAEKVFYKPETIPKEIKEYEDPIEPSEIVGDVTLEKLNQIFQMVMRRKKDREDPVRSRFGKITREKYKVEDRMRDIRRQIRGLRRINFRTLLDIQPTKEMVIVTFLAVLELMKVGDVTVSQEKNFGEIYMDAVDA